MRTFGSIEALEKATGEEIGVSDWLVVDQDRIDQFADATGDHQWIHVDAERAADGPFGTTIAHGFLTLALIVPLQQQVYNFENRKMALNYGLDKVRFPSHVPAGSRLRARVTVASTTRVGDDGVQVVWSVTVEREGGDRPVCVAESLTRVYFA